MNCAKCGLELPPGVKQCPKCGKVKPVVYAIAVLAVLAILAITFAVIAGRGQKDITTAPPGTLGPPGNVVTAPPGQPAGGNVVSAPPPPGVAKPKPPKDVVDYLEYVKKVEEHRQMLLKDTTNALTLTAASGGAQSLMGMIDMAMDPDADNLRDPLADVKKELNRQYKNWISTLEYFDRKLAPLQCREFSGAYRDVLYRETKTIGEIAVSFNGVNMMDPKDMRQLLDAMQKLKKDPTIQQNIDLAADNADGRLNQIVSQYDMEKPFDVPREQKTSGSIMGF